MVGIISVAVHTRQPEVKFLRSLTMVLPGFQDNPIVFYRKRAKTGLSVQIWYLRSFQNVQTGVFFLPSTPKNIYNFFE